MKFSKVYKANEREFYIMKGNKQYFPSTQSKTEEEAKQKGAILSAEWHLEQAIVALKGSGDLMNLDQSVWFQKIKLTVLEIKDTVEQAHARHESFDPMNPTTWI